MENLNFDEVHLLWCASRFYDFQAIGRYVKSEIERRELSKKVFLAELKIKDPTSHNEIYPKILNYLQSVYKPGNKHFAAVSSGTPSMQACWILIAESNAFPLKLYRSDEPKWGVDVVRPVKLSAALPRIVLLEEENLKLKKSLLEKLVIDKKAPSVRVGEKSIDLSPMEFVYYTVFAERALRDSGSLKIGGIYMPGEFFDRVVRLHEEIFESADIVRDGLKKVGIITCNTFRTTITRLNNKIKRVLRKREFYDYYLIESEGRKFSKRYSLSLPGELISIK